MSNKFFLEEQSEMFISCMNAGLSPAIELAYRCAFPRPFTIFLSAICPVA